MEAEDKFVVSEAFLGSFHGQLGCIACHGGQNVADMEEAHRDIVVQPSAGSDHVCASCHGDIAETYALSLHSTTAGIERGLERLAYPHTYNNNPALAEVYEHDCSSCHASCGECHVSRPRAIGGGVHTQHEFVREPPIEDTCWGCHGARNAGEYIGNVNGIRTVPDVHFQADMHCSDCHALDNFHGSGEFETGMWDLDTLPSCTDCHSQVYAADSPIDAHRYHEPDMMSCQVCHSLPVNNCTGCHVSPDGGSTMTSRMQFKIGLNPNPDEKRPYTYVALRHVPTTKTMLDAFEEGLLQNFDNITSYKISPSHNIQRTTPQNRDCQRCHGNERIFLQARDLPADGSPANERLIVDPIPD